MTAKTSWTVCFVASLAAFCYLPGLVCLIALVFAVMSFGFLYNNGQGVADGQRRAAR